MTRSTACRWPRRPGARRFLAAGSRRVIAGWVPGRGPVASAADRAGARPVRASSAGTGADRREPPGRRTAPRCLKATRSSEPPRAPAAPRRAKDHGRPRPTARTTGRAARGPQRHRRRGTRQAPPDPSRFGPRAADPPRDARLLASLRARRDWRRPPARARLVLEVPGAVAVCFDAPVVELFETPRRAGPTRVAVRLGPDLLADEFDQSPRRCAGSAHPGRGGTRHRRGAARPAGAGRHRQRVQERGPVDRRGRPVRARRGLDDATLGRLVGTARLLLRNVGSASRTTTGGDRRAMGSRLWTYGRTGRPCRRCGTAIRAQRQGERPRVTYWCPGCQIVGRATAGHAAPVRWPECGQRGTAPRARPPRR